MCKILGLIPSTKEKKFLGPEIILKHHVCHFFPYVSFPQPLNKSERSSSAKKHYLANSNKTPPTVKTIKILSRKY
jgi:hypothetical protein